MNRPPVLTVDTSDPKKFEEECARLHEAGYKMRSCNCGFANSEAYDFCGSWQAIFIDDGV